MMTRCIVDAEKDADMKNLSPEEAITILEGMRIDIPVPKAAVTQRKRNVALDMAISALNCSEIPNSSDHISRQVAIETLDEQIALCDKALKSFEISMKDEYAVKVERASLVAYKEQLEAIPAENVVPVIRCGQCKYWQGNDGDHDYGYCYAKDGQGFGHAWGKNDFCSYGEKREE